LVLVSAAEEEEEEEELHGVAVVMTMGFSPSRLIPVLEFFRVQQFIKPLFQPKYTTFSKAGLFTIPETFLVALAIVPEVLTILPGKEEAQRSRRLSSPFGRAGRGGDGGVMNCIYIYREHTGAWMFQTRR